MKVSPVERAPPTLPVAEDVVVLDWDPVELVDLTPRAVMKSNYTWEICPLIRMSSKYETYLKSMVKLAIASCPRIVIVDVPVDLHLLPCLPRRPKRLVTR